MKRILVALVLLIVSSGVIAQGTGRAPFIAVRGHAEIRVVPDVFPVLVSFSDTNMDGARAQSTIEQLIGPTIASAKAIGLGEADMSIGNLAVSAKREYDEKIEQNKFLGTEYRRELEFRFRTLAGLKTFLAGLPARKEVQARTLEFRLAEPGAARRKLLAAAIEDARETGVVFASGAGKVLGEVQTISDRPLQLEVGSYVNAIDVSSVESTTILTADQLARVPVSRNITNVALLAPGSVRGDSTEIALSEGVLRVSADVYVIYFLKD